MSINVTDSYNLLRECKYIRNVDRCIHDTNTGFEAVFTESDHGFDVYTGMSAFIANGHFLWGISESTSCMVSRSIVFNPTFEAELFSTLEIDMLVRYDEAATSQTISSLNGRIEWQMTADGEWRSDSYDTFTVYPDGQWHKYTILLIEKSTWVGDCLDFRLYPFTNGYPNMEVFIRRIAFSSDTHYKCDFPPCAYNRSYSHPCPGAGTHTYVYNKTRKTSVTVNDNKKRLGVSIDGFPVQYIDLDLSHCTDVYSIAQDITIKLNMINIGGYRFAECTYDSVYGRFHIHSGTKGSEGTISLAHGGENDVGEELGFFDSSGNPTWSSVIGIDPADGYAPRYHKLPGHKLYRLAQSNWSVIDYDPNYPAAQIGRSDIRSLPSEMFYEEGRLPGMLMIDIFGRVSYPGTLKKLYYKGNIIESPIRSRIFLLRPSNNYEFEIIYEKAIYSSDKITDTLYEMSIDWVTESGDVLGLYCCEPVVADEELLKLYPEMRYRSSWVEKRELYPEVGQKIGFTPYDLKFFGYESLPVYAESEDRMLDIAIEAELRNEYGVSHVAFVGLAEDRSLEVNLTGLESTLYRFTSVDIDGNETVGSLTTTSGASYDLGLDLETHSHFYLDFYFPGNIRQVFHTNMTFEQARNLRAFEWERWIEPEDRPGISWGGEYAFTTPATTVGSEKPWARIGSPLQVVLNGTDNYTYTPYLGFNYVTGDPLDYFPDLTEDEVDERASVAAETSWYELDQVFIPMDTRALRLYCWGFEDTQINSIDISCLLGDMDSLLQSTHAVGYSGPVVFSTETYEVVDIEGDVFSAGRVSRIQENEYTLSLDFSYLDDSTIIAPVGTTLSRIFVEIGDVKTHINEIKLIPQATAVRVEGAGDEPITEISDLQWGSPSDGSSYTMGPARSYKVCNDTGHRAHLVIDVADPLAVNQSCVFYSSLATTESLEDPTRGTVAKLSTRPDYLFSNHDAINFHAKVYALNNVAPDYWYSSTTSGEIWQLEVSGTSLSSNINWNEPEDPEHSGWYAYNISKATEFNIEDSSLNITTKTRTNETDELGWKFPTYFIPLSMDESISIETKVTEAIDQFESVDSSAGIVLFDNENRDNFIRIERYSGNELLVPFGDYVCYGNSDIFTGASGIESSYVNLDRSSYELALRLDKDQYAVDVSYRLPWDTWTTASSLNIENWSDDLRVGLFVGGRSINSEQTSLDLSSSFSYLSYRKSADKVVKEFDWTSDLTTVTTSGDGWVSYNATDSEYFRSTSSSIYINKWYDDYVPSVFDYTLTTPALGHTFGSIDDHTSLQFRITADPKTLASGTHSAGMLLRDKNNTNNYFQFVWEKQNQLGLYNNLTSSGTIYLDWINPTASGLWMRLEKYGGQAWYWYSTDGETYTVASGSLLTSWTPNTETEVVLSTDLYYANFDNIEYIATVTSGTQLVCEFYDPIPLLNIYGRQFEWDSLEYSVSTSGIQSFSATKPDWVRYVKIERAANQELDRDLIKFFPDPVASTIQGYNTTFFEVPNSNSLLYDYSGIRRVEVPGGDRRGEWPTSISHKGLPHYDYPVIALDFGQHYLIGRYKISTNEAKGRFSDSEERYPTFVEWESTSRDYYGFDGFKCLSSTGEDCTAQTTNVKIKQIYNRSTDEVVYYVPGVCDGLETDAGQVYKVCPGYSRCRARWWLLENQDLINTTGSGGTVWFVGGLGLNPNDYPMPLTINENWWATDYGRITWVREDPDRILIYRYPGLNQEGSIAFNPLGSPFYRLAFDDNWTYEDKLSVSFKLPRPEGIDSLTVRVGRDPECCYEFTTTGTLSTEWTTHEWYYSEGERVGDGIEAMEEPWLTESDKYYYIYKEGLPMTPLPYCNLGFVEITALGNPGTDIYIKDLKNVRTRFKNNSLYLGHDEALYIQDIELSSNGTIKFDYTPSLAPLRVIPGDPRDLVLSVLSVSNGNANISVVLHPRWGWNMYILTPDLKLQVDFATDAATAEKCLPSEENPGPFSVVLSWSAGLLPGQTDNVILWINGHAVCRSAHAFLGDYLVDNLSVTLGRGNMAFDPELSSLLTGCGYFANLSVYKYGVGEPSVDLDDQILVPEALIELSEDGTTWKSFAAGNLPLRYTGVEHGECRTFYMRNKRPSADVKSLYTRHTANLEVKWEQM